MARGIAGKDVIRRIPTQEIARVRRLARSRGGRLLSERPVQGTLRLKFACAEGHSWSQTARKLEIGKWCPDCARANKQRDRKAAAYARLRRVVANRGGEILSTGYLWSQVPLRFRCAQSHEWIATPSSVLRGSWCRVCGLGARGEAFERRVQTERRIAEGVARRIGVEMLPPGFQTSSRRVRLRCARGHEWTMLGAHLLGEVGCPQCRTDSRLSNLQRLAGERGGRCLAEAVSSYAEKLGWECARGHRFLATGATVRSGSWCPTCHAGARGSIEHCHRIAESRGGCCLSRVYLGRHAKLRWQCHEGHVWESYPSVVQSGHWCPKCSRLGRTRPARLSITDMHAVASEREGACLSKRYFGSYTKLKWRCREGHVWNALPWQVRQGHWCPACSRRYPGTLEGMRQIAEERRGRVVSRSWTDHLRPVQFECARGHRFGLLGVVAKSGVWCPMCAAGRRGGRGKEAAVS